MHSLRTILALGLSLALPRAAAAAPAPAPEVEPGEPGEPGELSDPSAGETDEGDDDDDRPRRRRGGYGLVYGGAVLLGLGLGSVAIGATGMARAADIRRELEDLGGESPATITGYASGYYSCDGVSSCPPQLEDQFELARQLGTVSFVVGGVLLAGGVALVTAHVVNRRRTRGAVELRALGPAWLPGGAGISAQLRF